MAKKKNLVIEFEAAYLKELVKLKNLKDRDTIKVAVKEAVFDSLYNVPNLKRKIDTQAKINVDLQCRLDGLENIVRNYINCAVALQDAADIIDSE